MPVENFKPPICPYCGKPSALMTQKEWYGKDFSGRMLYGCRSCDASVGTHPNGKPLGTLANKELKLLRQQCHALIDPIWQNGILNRYEVYARIKKQFQIEHIGESTKEECLRLIKGFKNIMEFKTMVVSLKGEPLRFGVIYEDDPFYQYAKFQIK